MYIFLKLKKIPSNISVKRKQINDVTGYLLYIYYARMRVFTSIFIYAKINSKLISCTKYEQILNSAG